MLEIEENNTSAVGENVVAEEAKDDGTAAVRMRSCSKCGEEKVECKENFKTSSKTGKLRSTCRECDNAYNRQYKKDNREKVYAQKRKNYDAKRRTTNRRPKKSIRREVNIDGNVVVMKICTQCGVEKPENADNFHNHGNNKLSPRCKDCNNLNNRIYASKNKDRIAARNREYNSREEVKAKHRKKAREYAAKNKDKIKERRKKNKGRINERKRERRKSDPIYRIRDLVSKRINEKIKSNGSVKDGSMLSKLPYKISELKDYLEALFEPWMSWENHGPYIPTAWDDNDPTTWTWQIDHIIPHSMFKYADMDCQEFRDCWTLSNLRPYSAKQNTIDGVTRVRHNKIEADKQ